jgi:hypothetical protein
MTDGWTQIMGLDPYELQLSLPAGEAVARYLRHKYPENTAKLVSQDTGLDPRTVENVLDRHLSGPTLTKLVLAYRLDLGLTLISAILGESIEQAAHREIEEIADARRRLEEREGAVRGRYAAMRAVAAVEPRGLRLVPQDGLGAGGERRAGPGRLGAGQAGRSEGLTSAGRRARP